MLKCYQQLINLKSGKPLVLKRIEIFLINPMHSIQIIIITVFMSSQLVADEVPACPDRGNDPDKFCPVAMIWSEKAQQCLGMVKVPNYEEFIYLYRMD